MPADNQPEDMRHRIDQLNSEAWEVRVSDSGKSFLLSSEAVSLARQIDYKKGLAHALRTYGFGLIRLSKHKEAMLALDESFDLFSVLGEVKETSPIYEYYGIVHRSLGNFDASLEALYKALDICEGTAYQEETSLVYYHLGATYKYMGNYEKALQYLLQSLTLARDINYWVAESYALNLLGQVYFETGDFQQALTYYQQSLQIRKTSGDLWGEAGCLDNIGYTYYKLSLLEKAVQHCTESLAICRSNGDKKGQANVLFHLSEVYLQQGNAEKALATADESLEIRKSINDKKGQAEVLLRLAELSLPHKTGTAVEFLKGALEIANEVKAQDLLSNVHFHFYTAYKSLRDHEKALQSLETFNRIERELHKDALAEKIINLQITHNIETAKQEAENYRQRNAELAALYEELKRQKEETELQKQKAEESLQQLKETQAQLVQREKMASLGELIAGVAHEIQNPLNFINNFAELNLELMEEMKAAFQNKVEPAFLSLSADLEHNLLKIVQHGNRADSIVKSMLQHSGRGSGKNEAADINALAEEYLRLSYHGMRAKDGTFTACLNTAFDESLGAVKLNAQEIGRVLLNIYNNAFYAVCEKRKQFLTGYEPTISVTSRKAGRLIEVSIGDNGVGIPPRIRNKIFQPFFTTKPTGEGTGLGLSLSYDIVTKGYGGDIKVETTEGEGTTFILQLPYQPAS